MPLTRLCFTNKVFNGAVVDEFDQTVYNLSTEKRSLSKGPTIVTRADGELVGQISWSSLDHSKEVTFHGRTVESLLVKKREKWYKSGMLVFDDDSGNSYIWDDTECKTEDGKSVATFTPVKEHLTREDEKASLMVDQQYLPILDHILFTALEVEKKRRSGENVKASADIFSAVAEVLGS